MAGLIDFHTNCNCGADVHAYLATLHDETIGPALQLRVVTTGALIERRLPLDALPTPTTEVVKQGVPGPDLLAPALETIDKLMASATWLVEQAEAGEGIDIAEVRERFGLDQGDALPDETPQAAAKRTRGSAKAADA